MTQDTTDKIILRGLTLYGHHGVHQAERTLGQRFCIELECGISLDKAGTSDNIAHTVGYDAIFASLERRFHEKTFQLLEALAEAIAQGVLVDYPPLLWVRVQILKSHAPIATTTGQFGVEIIRYRHPA